MVSACVSNYYKQYGGYPFDSQEFVIKEDKVNIRLLVKSRYLLEDEVVDSTQFNVSVKIVVPKQDLTHLSIEKLVFKAIDGSYYFAYKNPAVYDTFGRFPIANTGGTDKEGGSDSSENLCIFTVNNSPKGYHIILTYKLLNSQGEYESFEKTLPLVIADKEDK
jgi:hypothetical protein